MVADTDVNGAVDPIWIWIVVGRAVLRRIRSGELNTKTIYFLLSHITFYYKWDLLCFLMLNPKKLFFPADKKRVINPISNSLEMNWSESILYWQKPYGFSSSVTLSLRINPSILYVPIFIFDQSSFICLLSQKQKPSFICLITPFLQSLNKDNSWHFCCSYY